MCASAGLLSFVLHLDKHLSAIIAKHGQATYGILFAIVFAETGLVLTPFLPGESPHLIPWTGSTIRTTVAQLRFQVQEACIIQRDGDAGDSLLFAAGAFAALGSLNVWAVSGVFITAAILGDAVNYAVGNFLGALSHHQLHVPWNDASRNIISAALQTCHSKEAAQVGCLPSLLSQVPRLSSPTL